MKEIKFTFEREEDYNNFINNLLAGMLPEVGIIEVDETSINVVIKNLEK